MIRAYDDNGNVVDLVEWEKKIRADELDKIYKMMLLGCDELDCEKCNYRIHSQSVCQQAYTFEMIEKYIAEQLKEQKNENELPKP